VSCPVLFLIFIYYCLFVCLSTTDCPPDLLPQEITDQVTYFRDAISLVSDFTGFLAQSASGGLQQICGFDEPERVSNLARSTNENLCDVAAIMVTIREYFQCRNWYPLYETTVYEAMCYEGTKGFAWVASTQFVVVVMAMLLLTFRGAFHDLEIVVGSDEDDEDADSTGKSVERGGAANTTTQQERSSPPPAPRVQVSPHQDGGFELSPQREL
jgi:hypothetical protein